MVQRGAAWCSRGIKPLDFGVTRVVKTGCSTTHGLSGGAAAHAHPNQVCEAGPTRGSVNAVRRRTQHARVPLHAGRRACDVHVLMAVWGAAHARPLALLTGRFKNRPLARVGRVPACARVCTAPTQQQARASSALAPCLQAPHGSAACVKLCASYRRAPQLCLAAPLRRVAPAAATRCASAARACSAAPELVALPYNAACSWWC